MANDLNRCEFIGRLGADPEVGYLSSGAAVVNFRIACGRQWTDKNTGEKQEKTEWISLVAFGRLGEVIGQGALVKGDSEAGSVLGGQLERLYRTASIITFGGGTNEIQRDIISAAGLWMPRASR